MAVADLSGDGTTLTYDLPVQLTGFSGTDGSVGAQGVQGISSGFLYQRSTSMPTRPSNGTGTYSNEAITLSGWTTDTSLGSGLLYAVGWIYNAAGATAIDRIKYSPVWQMEGPPGQRGAVGPRGNDGSANGGNDGSSSIFMYRASSITLRSIPTGGSWVRSSHTFTPPSNWYDTYAGAEAAGNSGDPIYVAAVYLSGTADTVNAYSHPIRLSGPPGKQGPVGPVGPASTVAGPQGKTGKDGLSGKYTLPIFLNAATKPSLPSGLSFHDGAILGLGSWTREAPDPIAGQELWRVPVEINPNTGDALAITIYEASGEEGQRGTNAPQPQIQYSVDGSTGWATSVPNSYFIRFSVDGGTTWTAGERFRQDGTAGTNAPEPQIQYSVDGTTGWSPTTPNPSYFRFSVDGGNTWGTAQLFKGADGARAPPTQIQFSVDGRSGWGTSVTDPYFIRFSVDGGTIWTAGERFRQDGTAGTNGASTRVIFQESTTEPSLPTGGSWDGRTFRTPTGWSENTPTRTVNDPEDLYATVVELPGGGGPPHYTGIMKLTGDVGRTGNTGIRGVGTELIFRIASTAPVAPSSGVGTWTPSNGDYTPPSGWSLDSHAFTGTQNLYAVKVTLPGDSTEETYGSVFRLNGSRGATGARGPEGGSPGAGAGNDGDSLDAIYRTSSNANDNTILGVRPTGGTRSGNALATAPTDWALEPPTSISRGTYVYMAVADLSGDGTTLTYDLPVQLTGFSGTDGSVGAQGVQGISSGFLYQRSTSMPTRPANGTGTYSNEAITLSGWTTDTSLGSGLLYAVGWIYNAAGATAIDRIKYSPVWQMEGPPGQRGAVGPRGNDGSANGGNDGSSSIFMYRASSTTLRSIPTGGSWVRSSHTFTPPSDWYDTYAGAEAAGNSGDPIYIAAVYLSGTADTVNAYSHPIRLSGPPGKQGPVGPASTVPGPIGPQGKTGKDGLSGKYTLPIFLNAATKPSLPSGLSFHDGAILGLGSWTREAPDPVVGQELWRVPVEINPNTGDALAITIYEASGEEGQRGINAPQPQIQYSVDGSTGWGTSVPNSYFIRFSVDGGTTWTAGERFRQDGTAGANGFGYQNYYHANTNTTVTIPTITYNGSAFNAASGWQTTIPTTPQGANVFVAPVRYQAGTAGQTVEGVVLFGTVPRAVIPPSTSTYSSGIEYGIANGNTPSSTHSDSNSFSLSIGGTHTTESLTFAATTIANGNYYVRLPAGLTLTRAVDSVQGDETSSWVRVASSQVWIYTIGFDGATNTFVFTVRRDN